MPERIVVGVDAGGSRTDRASPPLVKRRENRLIAGPANPRSGGVERAAIAIASAVAGALRIEQGRCGVRRRGRRVERRGRRSAARRARGAPRAGSRRCDARRGYRAAAVVPHGDGLLLVAGTGSIAYAEIGEKRFRSGGLGHALGDEGSGYAIGAATLRLLGEAFDGRALRDPMLDAVARKARRLGCAGTHRAVADARRGPATVAIGRADRHRTRRCRRPQRDQNRPSGGARSVRTGPRARSRVRLGAVANCRSSLPADCCAKTACCRICSKRASPTSFHTCACVKGGPEPHEGALAAARRLAERSRERRTARHRGLQPAQRRHSICSLRRRSSAVGRRTASRGRSGCDARRGDRGESSTRSSSGWSAAGDCTTSAPEPAAASPRSMPPRCRRRSARTRRWCARTSRAAAMRCCRPSKARRTMQRPGRRRWTGRRPDDAVVGLSASGSAKFVISRDRARACARRVHRRRSSTAEVRRSRLRRKRRSFSRPARNRSPVRRASKPEPRKRSR